MESEDKRPPATADTPRDAEGVDLTLIDELLRMEPIERLRLNDRAVNAVLELRRAIDAGR